MTAEIMGVIGSVIDRRANDWQVDGPIRCDDCSETFLWWATFCEHLPKCGEGMRDLPRGLI